MGLTQIHLMFYSLAVFFFVALAQVSGDDILTQKRPFCNSFSGCGGRPTGGKKRLDESMASLMQFNSEPAVEELSKQILSEAKLLEAIQEARAELDFGRVQKPKMTEHGSGTYQQQYMPYSSYSRFSYPESRSKRLLMEMVSRKLTDRFHNIL